MDALGHDKLGHDEIWRHSVWAWADESAGVASDVNRRLLAHVDNTLYWPVHHLVFAACCEETEGL